MLSKINRQLVCGLNCVRKNYKLKNDKRNFSKKKNIKRKISFYNLNLKALMLLISMTL